MWDIDGDIRRLSEQKTENNAAYFEGRISAEERTQRALVRTIEEIRLVSIRHFAERNGIPPENVQVTSQINQLGMKEVTYSMKP